MVDKVDKLDTVDMVDMLEMVDRETEGQSDMVDMVYMVDMVDKLDMVDRQTDSRTLWRCPEIIENFGSASESFNSLRKGCAALAAVADDQI